MMQMALIYRCRQSDLHQLFQCYDRRSRKSTLLASESRSTSFNRPQIVPHSVPTFDILGYHVLPSGSYARATSMCSYLEDDLVRESPHLRAYT